MLNNVIFCSIIFSWLEKSSELQLNQSGNKVQLTWNQKIVFKGYEYPRKKWEDMQRKSFGCKILHLPGNSAHDFRSISRTYVESFASLQIDKWRDIGDDRSKFTQPVIV